MNRALSFLVLFGLFAGSALGGDDASGPIEYSVDLAAMYEKHELSGADIKWSKSLVTNLRYSEEVVHFVRTTLPLLVDGAPVEGMVYQAVEKPDYFYVVPGDAMLRIGAPRPYAPGAGGFSMHAPKSRNFVVCLNWDTGGVPFLSSSEIKRGRVTWNGRDWRRF